LLAAWQCRALAVFFSAPDGKCGSYTGSTIATTFITAVASGVGKTDLDFQRVATLGLPSVSAQMGAYVANTLLSIVECLGGFFGYLPIDLRRRVKTTNKLENLSRNHGQSLIVWRDRW